MRLYMEKMQNPIMLGLEIIQQASNKIKMIKEKIKTSQDKQKSYNNKQRKHFEFQEDMFS